MSPTGTDISAARAVMTRVPAMAWYAPPPSPTIPRIEYVKNSTSNRAIPLLTTVTTTDTSGASATRNAAVTTIATSLSVAFRLPSTTRESRYNDVA
jgi:hypothetical protein